MSISKKRVQRTGNTEIDRALADVYKDLNDIVDAVNQSATPTKSSHTGSSGDLRLVKNGNDNFSIEGKFDEGWASLSMTLKET